MSRKRWVTEDTLERAIDRERAGQERQAAERDEIEDDKVAAHRRPPAQFVSSFEELLKVATAIAGKAEVRPAGRAMPIFTLGEGRSEMEVRKAWMTCLMCSPEQGVVVRGI